MAGESGSMTMLQIASEGLSVLGGQRADGASDERR